MKTLETLEREFIEREAQIDTINALITDITCVELNEDGRADLRRLIRGFGGEEVYTATEIAFTKYYSPSDIDTWEYAFSKIGGICYNRQQQRTGRRT